MVKILIAAGDEGTQASLRGLLEPQGHEIVTLRDGPEALRHAEQEEADLMLADLDLPGIEGLELLARVRATRPELGVILLAAFGSVEDAVRAMQEGAADFLSKPFTDEQVQRDAIRLTAGEELARRAFSDQEANHG